MPYSVPSSTAGVITNLCLCYAFVSLRCYVRIALVKNFWCDDWFALGSLVRLQFVVFLSGL